MLFVDLDEFKNVNNTLGHEAGDQLLVAVAARLKGTLRDADTIGRMGGDEFVVLIDGGELEVAPELVADITSSPESRALIGTLVQLGRDLGLTTLAEGVETPAK